MNIYDEDENVDLDLALAELKRSDGMTDPRRKFAVAEISAAALLDIAGSLRIIAHESAVAMTVNNFGTLDVPTDDEPEGDRDFIVEGDLVAVEGREVPGEVTRIFFTEGEHFADIAFADATMATLPLATLHRLVGDERDDEAMRAATEASIDAVHDEVEDPTYASSETADPADLVDDIDADFDGAVHPAAESALDLLKANEAARKAAKKSGPKKGSKK